MSTLGANILKAQALINRGVACDVVIKLQNYVNRKPPFVGSRMQYARPYVCCVIGCSSRREKDDCLTFHKIPTINGGRTKEKETTSRLAAWLEKINRKNWLPSESGYIISVPLLIQSFLWLFWNRKASM